TSRSISRAYKRISRRQQANYYYYSNSLGENMKKTLILLLLASFSMQLSAMNDEGEKISRKRKVDEIESKEEEEKNYAEIELAKQKKEWEDYYNQYYRIYEQADGTLVNENGLTFDANVESSFFSWLPTKK